MRREGRTILFVVIGTLLSFSGCKETGEVFSIDKFESFPGDSVGVGCFYYESGDDSKMVFASGPDSISYVSISGSVTGLTLSEYKEEKTSDSTWDFTQKYRNDEYELRLEMKQSGFYDGGSTYDGVMTVKNAKGNVVTRKIVGQCGC